MKRFSIIAILIGLCFQAYSVEPGKYRNPISDWGCADPTVWKDGDTFFLMSTGLPEIRTSRDLIHWEKCGANPLSDDTRARASGIGRHFWAPDVVKISGKWMMYLTMYNSAKDSSIGVYASDCPTGPWEYRGILTSSTRTGIIDTIDPEVVVDPQTERVWLFFGSTGKIHRIELNREGTEIMPGAEYVHVAGLHVESDRTREQVFEGAYLHKHGRWWYMFVSSGNYADWTYSIKVGRSKTLDGEFLDKEGQRMTDGFGTVFMSSQPRDPLFGPGHNGEIFSDANGQDFIFYHCHDKERPYASIRELCLQRVFWDRDGWPFVVRGCPTREGIMPVLN